VHAMAAMMRGGWGRLEEARRAVDVPAGVRGSGQRGASLVAWPRRSGRQRSRSKSEAESYVTALGARGWPVALDKRMRSGNFFFLGDGAWPCADIGAISGRESRDGFDPLTLVSCPKLPSSSLSPSLRRWISQERTTPIS
jgi:hypothetical protein